MIGLGTLSLGQYDTVRITVTNATMLVNNTSEKVQLSSSVFTVPVSFLVPFGREATIVLKVASVLDTGCKTCGVTQEVATLKLSFTAVSAPSPSQ
jgi:hypothetical protein